MILETSTGIQFESGFGDIESALDYLVHNDNGDFSRSLVTQFHNKGSLSPKQEVWAHKIATEAKERNTNQEKVDSKAHELTAGKDYSKIFQLFSRAKDHLKRPRVTIVAEKGSTQYFIRLSIAGEKSKHPGTIILANDYAFYGRIMEDGRFVAGERFDDNIAQALEDLEKDPVGTATKFGKLTGKCCFCTLPLKDADSTRVGYGPVCADHWDLPWGANFESKLKENWDKMSEGTRKRLAKLTLQGEDWSDRQKQKAVTDAVVQEELNSFLNG